MHVLRLFLAHGLIVLLFVELGKQFHGGEVLYICRILQMERPASASVVIVQLHEIRVDDAELADGVGHVLLVGQRDVQIVIRGSSIVEGF